VTGFTDAEGHFFVSLKNKNTKLLPNITLGYKVSQKEDSGGVLYDLQRFFKCGRVVKEREGYLKYEVTKFDDIICKIIPHFKLFPLVTSKFLNFVDLEKVAEILVNNKKITLKESDYIFNIISNMNKGRTFEDKFHFTNSLNISLKPE
ncbi:homing endonuclease, partial [Dacryopinax primogenitus]